MAQVSSDEDPDISDDMNKPKSSMLGGRKAKKRQHDQNPESSALKKKHEDYSDCENNQKVYFCIESSEDDEDDKEDEFGFRGKVFTKNVSIKYPRNLKIGLEDTVLKVDVDQEESNSDNQTDEDIPYNPAASSEKEDENTQKACSLKEVYRAENKIFSLLSNDCPSSIVLLRKPVFLYGAVRMKLIHGSVEVFGYQVKNNDWVEIYSSEGCGLLGIHPLANLDKSITDVSELPFFKKSGKLIEFKSILNIQKQLNVGSDALVLLQKIPYEEKQEKFEIISKFCKSGFWNKNCCIDPLYFGFHMYEEVNHFCLKTDLEWNKIEVTSEKRIMVTGGKSVGKSTLCRYLINKCVEEFGRILLIDLDIGQPEVYLPQTISATVIDKPLLGSGYIYGKQPRKSFLCNSIDITKTETCYQRYLIALSEYCHGEPEFQNIPWIINTMGYNSGFSYRLILMYLLNFKPTDVIQIQSQNKAKNFPFDMTFESIKCLDLECYGIKKTADFDYDELAEYKLIVLNSVVDSFNENSQFKISSKKNRNRIIRAHCATIFPKGFASNENNFYRVSLKDVEIISLDQISKTKKVYLMIGTIIYMCSRVSDSIECLGLGVVKEVRDTCTIVLMTGLSQTRLQNINVLAVTDNVMPKEVIVEQDVLTEADLPFIYKDDGGVLSMHVEMKK